MRALGELVPPKPMVLRADFGGEIDASTAAAAWDRWTPPDVSAETFAALSTAVDELQSQALAVLRRRAEALAAGRVRPGRLGVGRPGRARRRRLGSPTCGRRSTGCGRSACPGAERPSCSLRASLRSGVGDAAPGEQRRARPDHAGRRGHAAEGRARRDRRRRAWRGAVGDEPGRAARARPGAVPAARDGRRLPVRVRRHRRPGAVDGPGEGGRARAGACLRPRLRGRSWCSRTTTGCPPRSANSSSRRRCGR